MKKCTIKYKDLLYIFIILILICSIFQNTLLKYSFPAIGNFINNFYKILRIFVLMFGIAHFLNKKMSIKRMIVCLIFIAIFFMNFYKTKYFMFFDMFFIPLFFMDYLDYKTIINVYLYVLIITLLIIMVMYLFHMFPNSVFSIWKNSQILYRESFGFGHPNSFGRHIFLISCLFFLKARKSEFSNIFSIIFLIIFILLVALYAQSMTAFYSILFLGIYVIYNKLFGNIKVESFLIKIFKKILPIFVPTILVISYLIFSKGLFIDRLSSISNTLSSRYILASNALNEYGVGLFGKKVQFIGKSLILFDSNYSTDDYSQVDNFIIYFVITSGIVATIFFVVYYVYILKRSLKLNDKFLSYVLIIMIIYSFTENSIVLASSGFIFMLPLCKDNDIINYRNVRNKEYV